MSSPIKVISSVGEGYDLIVKKEEDNDSIKEGKELEMKLDNVHDYEEVDKGATTFGKTETVESTESKKEEDMEATNYRVANESDEAITAV